MCSLQENSVQEEGIPEKTKQEHQHQYSGQKQELLWLVKLVFPTLLSQQPTKQPASFTQKHYLRYIFAKDVWHLNLKCTSIITTSKETIRIQRCAQKIELKNFHSLRAFSSTSCHRMKTQHSIFYISNPSKSLESFNDNLSGCVPQDYHLNSETKWKMSVQILGLLAWKSLANQLG